MSFFHKKMSQYFWATIMSFGTVTLIFYWPKKKIGPHFRHWNSGTQIKMVYNST